MNLEEVPLGIGLTIALVGAAGDLLGVDGDVDAELADLVTHGLEPAYAPRTKANGVGQPNTRRP